MLSGFGAQLSAQFAPLLAAVKTAGAQIARNAFAPLREAAEKIEKKERPEPAENRPEDDSLCL